MRIYILLILTIIFNQAFPQNSKPDSLHRFTPDSLKIRESVLLFVSSDKFSYDSMYIWSDKRNLSEILDERNGYFIFDFGLGGRNDINYNSKYSGETGIFRDGIQINDGFFRGFDIQNLSINEIKGIEEVSNTSSFYYGINSFAKSINIISKDVFNTKPFSQLRYSQDREGSLSADFYYSQPVSKKFNFQLGITKHSLDGRYENSSFNAWRGRSRINYFASNKLNIKLNFYLNNWERDLNDGLVYKSSKDSLADPENAQVVHPGTKEKIENYFFDLTAAGKFFKNKNSLTKLKIYGINSLRNLDNPDTVITLSNFPSGFYHTLQYGAELIQNIYFRHDKNSFSDISFGGNLYFNTFSGNLFGKFNDNYYSLRFKYDLNFRKLFVSAYLRDDYIRDKNYFNFGTETDVGVYSDNVWNISLNAGYNRTKYLMRNEAYFRIFGDQSESMMQIPRNYYEAGGKVSYKDLTVSGYVFGFSYDNTYDSRNGVNVNINLDSRYFYGNISGSNFQDPLFPDYYVKGDLAYRDVLFRGKLKLRTGINFRYYRIDYITNQYQTWYSVNNDYQTFPQKDQFIADYYIGARVGRANINITIANILNSLVYNSYVFPLDDRGGFLNAVSRFTIVWDFIN